MSKEHTSDISAENLRVVIIDDQPAMRQAFKRVLDHMGEFDVLDFPDGKEALKKMEDAPVDLILLDLFMPKMSGFQFLKHLREKVVGQDIPTIVITGEGSKEDIIKAVDLGATDYVLKPFQPETLEAKIKRVLQDYSSPSYALNQTRKGDRFLILKKFDMALKCYNNALESDPQFLRAKLARTHALIAMSKLSEAEKELGDISRQHESYFKAHSTLVDLLLKQNRNDEAISILKKELAINPRQAQRQILLAKLLEKKGLTEASANAYKAALDEDADSKEALLSLAKIHAQEKNLDKTLKYLRRIKKNDPELGIKLIVGTFIQFGDHSKAEQFLILEKAKNPSRLSNYLHLINYYLNAKDAKKCEKILLELLQIAPELKKTHELGIRAVQEFGIAALPNYFQVIEMMLKKEKPLTLEALFVLLKNSCEQNDAEGVKNYSKQIFEKHTKEESCELWMRHFFFEKEPVKSLVLLKMVLKNSKDKKIFDFIEKKSRLAILERRKMGQAPKTELAS